MTDQLNQRLRNDFASADDLTEAANEIERLTIERDKLSVRRDELDVQCWALRTENERLTNEVANKARLIHNLEHDHFLAPLRRADRKLITYRAEAIKQNAAVLRWKRAAKRANTDRDTFRNALIDIQHLLPTIPTRADAALHEIDNLINATLNPHRSTGAVA